MIFVGSRLPFKYGVSSLKNLKTSSHLTLKQYSNFNLIERQYHSSSASSFNYLGTLGFRRTNNGVCLLSRFNGLQKPLFQNFKRFNSSKAKNDDHASNNSQEGSKKEGPYRFKSFDEVFALLKLLKPELPTMGIALLFLFTSSGISMLFPAIIGAVIDNAKDIMESTTKDNESGSEVIPTIGTIRMLGKEIPLTVFYSSLGAIFLVGSVANFGRILLLRKIGERLMAKLRLRILKKIFYQDSKFWDVYKSGDLISRLVNDSTIVARSITQNVSDGLRSSISGLVGLVLMVFISAKLTGYMCLMFPFLIGTVAIFGTRIKTISRMIQQQLGNLTKVSEEQFNFTKTIQSFNNEAYEVGKFKNEVKQLYDLSLKEATLTGYFAGATTFVGNATIIALLVIGTNMVRQGELTIGDLSSFLMYTVYTGSSVYSLSNFYTELMKGVGASTRIFELMNLQPAIIPTKGKRVDDINGDIVFKNIKFNYPLRPNHTVFQDLNLTINKGDHVCLVGPSGCGKSTVTQLLLRYYEPKSGEIFVNGHELNEMSLAHFRKNIGIVQQEPMLFSGTIRENLVYGKRKATNAEIVDACKLANCYEFIQNFPDQFDTVIGAKGAQLSGGQKQRIALARSLICKPQILILDEATSALDTQSEKAIQETLERRQVAGLTTISIAHRLSTIKMSNKIVVFNSHGEIVEMDNFTALISNPDSELNKLLKKSDTGDDTEQALTEHEMEVEGETSATLAECEEVFEDKDKAQQQSVGGKTK